MASSINPSNIDGAYPVAGQDNDSQGFRDNFTNIKTNFTSAKSEIEALQTTSVNLTAENNFNFTGIISKAVMKNNADSLNALGTVGGAIILDVSLGIIHTATLNAASNLSFINWPSSGKGGRIRFIVTITDVAHTLTLPAAVTLGTETVAGISSLVITFPATGQYIYDFSTIDGGAVILVEDITQSDNTLGNFSFIDNQISSTNTNGDIVFSPNGAGTVKTGNLQINDNSISTTNVDGNLTLSPNGVGEIDIAGTTATISTSSTNQALTLSPAGTGSVLVPAGYKDRAGFGLNSLTTKEYVDGVIAGGSIASIPLRHGVTIGMMGATQANPVVVTASDGSVRSITGATQTNPVRITTSGSHNLVDRDRVFISGVLGMTDLNDLDFYVKRFSATQFDLYSDVWLATSIDGTGFGAWVSDGDVEKFIDHNLENGAKIQITGVVGMTQLNTNTYYANNVTATTFELYDDSSLVTSTDGTAFTAYTSGGSVAVQETILNGDILNVVSGTNMNVGVSNDKYTISLSSDIFGIDNLEVDVIELSTGGGVPTIQTPGASNSNLAINPDGTGTVLIGGTTPTITTASGDLKLDSAGGDIVYDADIELSSNSNGTIKTSGANQNIILDPNGAGVVSIAGDGTDATIASNALNESLELAPNGTGAIKVTVDGATHLSTSANSGAASALPAQPVGYIAITINGTAYKIPYYAT